MQRPHIVPTLGVVPTDVGAAADLQALHAVVAYQSCAVRVATEDARSAILQEFMDDLAQRGRPFEHAHPVDVLLYLEKWSRRKGTYVIEGVRHVAPTSMQQRVSHLKYALARYPEFHGPWHPSGRGKDP